MCSGKSFVVLFLLHLFMSNRHPQGGRLVWFVFLLAILLVSYPRLKDCGDGWIIMLYLGFSIFSFWLSIICELCLLRVSLKVRIIV